MRRVVNLRQILKVEMGVNLRRRNARVTEHLLHRAQVAARLQHVRRERVAQGMRMDFLVDPCPLGSLSAGIPHYFGGDGMIGCVPAPAWE